MFNLDYGWLTYGNEQFRWRFNDIIEIRPYHRKKNKILIEFDKQSLLNLINNRLKDDTNLEISHIPPEFLSKAIKKAIENGWKSKDDIGQITLYFKSNKFTIRR